MDKNEMIELIGVKNVENLGFLPENVRKEIVELKVKIDAAYENSEIIKKYQIRKYSVKSEILIINE
ncbi:MAG: hypothetical protein MR958_06590 [Spirochaetia bacterium]|nr:hypothetical protein [Spirochaetia bacterium]MDD7269501.1 hypothetical protein [Treponema sp.]MDY4985507.1 hypothetical protein [Treponema sp.]